MTRAATAELYEDANQDMVQAGEMFQSLTNGVREHLDRFAKISEYVGRVDPTSILDVGCHFGVVGKMVRLNHRRIEMLTGIDWSATAADFAKSFMGYDRVIVADAEDFQPDLMRSADLVLCLEILEHVHDPRILIGNCAGWTKEWVLFSTPNEAGDVDGEFHVRKIDLETLVDWVRRAELEVVHTEVLASKFCEPNIWQGWNFVLARRK